MLIVILGFVLFNATDVREAGQYIAAMFGFGGVPVISAEFVYYLRSFSFVLLAAVVGSTPLPKRVVEKVAASEKSVCKWILAVAEPVLLVVLLLLTTAYLVDGSFNPFLYLRF